MNSFDGSLNWCLCMPTCDLDETPAYVRDIELKNCERSHTCLCLFTFALAILKVNPWFCCCLCWFYDWKTCLRCERALCDVRGVAIVLRSIQFSFKHYKDQLLVRPHTPYYWASIESLSCVCVCALCSTLAWCSWNYVFVSLASGSTTWMESTEVKTQWNAKSTQKKNEFRLIRNSGPVRIPQSVCLSIAFDRTTRNQNNSLSHTLTMMKSINKQIIAKQSTNKW